MTVQLYEKTNMFNFTKYICSKIDHYIEWWIKIKN
jgi:hypothetical protein